MSFRVCSSIFLLFLCWREETRKKKGRINFHLISFRELSIVVFLLSIFSFSLRVRGVEEVLVKEDVEEEEKEEKKGRSRRSG